MSHVAKIALSAAIRQINDAFVDTTFQTRIAGLGGTPLTGSPADFGKLIVDEIEKWAVVRAAGIKVE